MTIIYLSFILLICIFDVKKYKTFLTPITVLFFPILVLVFINNFFSPWRFYKIDILSIEFIMLVAVIFFLVSFCFKNNKNYKIDIKKSDFNFIKKICILTLLMLICRFFYDLWSLGGLEQFELLKADRKNTFFSNFVEFFSIFIPVLLIYKKRKEKIIFIFFIFFQLLFQNKNKVFLLILESLFLMDIFFSVKMKKILKYIFSIIFIFFLIYNLKGFSQVGLNLNLKNHNLEILEHMYFYLISPLINIKIFYEKSFIEGGISYIFAPIIGIITKFFPNSIKKPNILYDFYLVSDDGRRSNVGSIFGEVLYVNNIYIYILFFIFLSIGSYYIFNKRKEDIYYALFSSFILATLALSFFSNIYNLLFIWKRIFVIVIVILIKKFFKIIFKGEFKNEKSIYFG